MRIPCAALCVLLLAASPARAQDDDGPSDGALLLAGAGMAIPAYFINVTVHEGSHALTAKAFGAEVLEFRVLPGRHPRSGAFYFGWVSYRGRLSRGQRAAFFVAPKLADLALLGGYAALVGFDALPDNEYGSLAFTVLATSTWVDFSKDVFSWRESNDLMKFHALYERDSEWQRLPWRALHLGLSAGAAYFIVQGYEDVFGDDAEAMTAVVLPVLTGNF